MRLGVRQRWETKRGPPGAERIIDWVVFDVEGSFFPDADRDNFGENVGLVNYDFRWHVGDRLTLLSDGYFDFYNRGLQTMTIGGFISRPELGNLYVGYRSLEGPFTASIVSTSVNYRMSEKWIATLGASVDLGPTGSIGQHFSATRIGESFLVTFGFDLDANKDNFGVNLAVEPRFLPGIRFGQFGSGARVPIAGSRGLE